MSCVCVYVFVFIRSNIFLIHSQGCSHPEKLKHEVKDSLVRD